MRKVRRIGVWSYLFDRSVAQSGILRSLLTELRSTLPHYLVHQSRNTILTAGLIAAVLGISGVVVYYRVHSPSELEKPLLQRTPNVETFTSPTIVKLRDGMPPPPAQPTLPSTRQADGWPDGEPLGLYLYHLGVSTVIDDGVVAWMLRMAKEHPNVERRQIVIQKLGLCFSRGRAGELMASTVSSHVKDEMVTFLIECCNSQVAEVRLSALAAITSGRLHLEYKALYDAAEDVYKNTTNLPPDRLRHIKYLWDGIQLEERMNHPR